MSVRSSEEEHGLHRLPSLVPASFYDSVDVDSSSDEDDESAPNYVPFDIHQYFGLSPGTPICLDSLPDPPPGAKPAYTYATLVKLAIWSSPQRRLTLAGIYEALENRFSWFKECENPNAWKTSIRHSLSLLSVFVKLPIDIHLPGKSHYWTVDFSKGDGYKRPRKRGKKHNGYDVRQEAGASSPLASSCSTLCSHPDGRFFQSGCCESWLECPDGQAQISRCIESDRGPRALIPYGKSPQLSEASPEPRFRHYRMCTYLYPDSTGSAASAAAVQVWNILEKQRRASLPTNGSSSEDDRDRNSPKARRSSSPHSSQECQRSKAEDNDMQGKTVNGNHSPGKSVDKHALQQSKGVAYRSTTGAPFQPSLASFQAHYMASASRSPYTFVPLNDKPVKRVKRAHVSSSKNTSDIYSAPNSGLSLEQSSLAEDMADGFIQQTDEAINSALLRGPSVSDTGHMERNKQDDKGYVL